MLTLNIIMTKKIIQIVNKFILNITDLSSSSNSLVTSGYVISVRFCITNGFNSSYLMLYSGTSNI